MNDRYSGDEGRKPGMIEVIKVGSREEGQVRAHELLRILVDGQTLLALSGGTSPNYQRMIVGPGDIKPGAICVVDDRFGEPFHEGSNERLLRDAGVKDFADRECIETHKILSGEDFSVTARNYNDAIAGLLGRFPKRVGVMGIGGNVHTAGIFPNSAAASSPDFVVGETVDDKFPERITVTLRALGEFSAFVILVFGEDKKEALKIMLDEGQNDMQKYPAVFYRMSSIPTYLITDVDL